MRLLSYYRITILSVFMNALQAARRGDAFGQRREWSMRPKKQKRFGDTVKF